MWRRGLTFGAAVAALLVTGCAADEGPRAETSQTATDEPSHESNPEASDEATDDPTADPAVLLMGTTKAVARAAVAAGTRALFENGAVDFRHTFTVGRELLVETAGRAFSGDSWSASTTFHDPQVTETYRMDVRAVGRDVYMQMLGWTGDSAGCWLRLGRGQVPVGQLAMTADRPAYVRLLQAVRPDGFDPDSDTVVTGQVGLDAVLELLSAQLVQQMDLTGSQFLDTTVAVSVYLEDGLVTDLSVTGSELAEALTASGGHQDRELAAGLPLMRLSVRYRPAPAQADPVTAPESGLVITAADSEDDEIPGCH